MPALWILVSALFFSAMGVCIKLASVQYSTAEILFFRSLIGLILIWLCMRLRHESVRSPYWKMHLSRSGLGVTAMALWFITIAWLPLAMAMTLNYTSPLWMAVLLMCMPLAYKKHWRLDIKLLCAILVSFIGVVCLLQPSLNNQQWFAGVLGLSAGLLAAMAYLTVRQLGQYGEPETRTVFYLSLVGVVFGGLWMLVTERHIYTLGGIMQLIGVGVFATIAQLALTRAYRFGNTLLVANLHYMGIVFSAVWGVLIWHEHLNLLSWIGIGLIVVNGMYATFARLRLIPAYSDSEIKHTNKERYSEVSKAMRKKWNKINRLKEYI